MYGLLVGFGLMFDKGQKQSSTLSCDSSYLKNFYQLYGSFPGVSLMMREVSHVCFSIKYVIMSTSIFNL